MDIERLKEGLMAADAAGDSEAATMFATKIRELQDTPKKSISERTLQNFKGLAAGTYDLARGLVVDMPLSVGMQVGGMLSGDPASVSRRAAQMAIEDTTSGIKARDFSEDATESSTYKMMMYPFEKITEGIEWAGDKIGEVTGQKELGEGSKIAMDIAGAVAPIPGAKFAGKTFMKGMERIDPALRDQPPRRVPELDPETVVAKRPPPEPKEYMGPLFENLKDVDTSDVMNPYRDNSQRSLFDDLERQQMEENARTRIPAEEGSMGPLFEKPVDESGVRNPFETPETRQGDLFGESALQRQQMEEAQRAADWEARRAEFGEDAPLRDPQELALDYDPFSLKDLDKVPEDWQVRDAIERGREDFPTVDIDLLPESIAKDSVIKGHLTKYNKLLEEHNKLMDQAREVAVQGERIRNQDVGRTKKSQQEVAEIQKQIAEVQKKMDVVNKQLYNRMSSAHGVTEPGMMLYRGRTPEKSGTPNMQRSPDANITGAGAVQKTFSPLGGVGKKQGGAFDFSGVGEELGKLFKGAKAVAKHTVTSDPNRPKNLKLSHENKIRKITGADSRDIPTFVKDVLKDKENLVDIPEYSLVRWDLTPSAVGRLSYENNPIISYVNNMLNKIDGATKMAKENALWGKGFGTNLRGKPVKGKSDDGARTIMKTIPKARQEGFRSTIVKYSDGKILEQMGLADPTDAMLKADGLNAREIQSYRAMRKQLDTVIDTINQTLVAKGEKPIPKKPGYFPSIWLGDYRVFVKDAQGNKGPTLGLDHPFEVSMAIAEMKKIDPSLTFETADASQNKYNINDLSAFQLASEVFGHDPRLSSIIDQARNKVLQHRGWKKHGLQKRGAEGFLGSQKGKFADMEKALDIYLEQAYNFISDQQKREVMGKINEEFATNGYEVTKELPNTNKYVNDIVANSIGATKNRLQFVDDFVEFLGKYSGYKFGVGGRSSGKKIMKMFNGFAGFYNLFTAKQWAINAAQPLYALAKAQHLKVELGTENVTLNLAKAYQEAFMPEIISKMSKESKDALEYARKSGLIDARTLELINANTGAAASNSMKAAGHAASWWEQEAVRVPAYLFYDHMLRETIKDPKARWEAAASLTEHTMVNYSKTQTPDVYSGMGIVGDAVRPYQQFTHNYHGQFLEYMQLAKRNKEFRPLATFLAAQATMGGVRGLVPLTVVGGLIAMYNNVPGVDPVPTPEEYLMGSGASDAVVFGPLSLATGANLSGSAGAPNIIPTPGMPGVSFAQKLATDGIGGGIKMMMGTDQEEDRMKAALAVAPSALKGYVEEAFALPDGRIPNPNRDMQPDVDLVRTPGERRIRNWAGAEPLREGAQKARIRAAESKQKRVEEKRKQYFDKFVDDVVSKGEFNGKALSEFMERGGDPSNVMSAVKTKLEKQIFSRVQEAVMKKEGLSKLEQIELMEKYQLELSQMTAEQLMELNQE